jgi:3-oxoacyl-[acyl-carrier-protein] synthase-3
MSSTLRSDGSGWDLLGLPTVGSRDTYLQEKLEEMTESEPNHRYAMHRLHMNGREVFRFATKVINDSIKDVLRQADIPLSELSLVIPHQANQRILESAARGLKIPVETFYSNVASYGNTSAASIPIALCEAIDEGLVKPGDNLTLVGFGGGLTWAAMAINWQTEVVHEPQRIMGVRRQLTYLYATQRRNVLRRWRRAYNRIAGSPTPNATMQQLRKRLENQPWEDGATEEESEGEQS